FRTVSLARERSDRRNAPSGIALSRAKEPPVSATGERFPPSAFLRNDRWSSGTPKGHRAGGRDRTGFLSGTGRASSLQDLAGIGVDGGVRTLSFGLGGRHAAN